MGIDNRGFASMTEERRKEVASLGGKSSKNRHKFTPEEARAASTKAWKNRRAK